MSFQIWKRKESEYSFLWRTHGLEKSELLRPEFTGKMQPSPITGQPEKYFPRWKRWLRYGLSFVLTLPVLALAIGAMLCSLNFNGYIKDKESPVYIAAFAYFAEPVSQLKYSFLSISLKCFFLFFWLKKNFFDPSWNSPLVPQAIKKKPDWERNENLNLVLTCNIYTYLFWCHVIVFYQTKMLRNKYHR